MKKNKFIVSFALLAFAGVAFIFYTNLFPKKQKIKSKIPDITIIGPVEMADGIGRQTAELAIAIKDELKIQIIARSRNDNDVPTKVKRILEKSYTQLGKVVIFEEPLWQPGLDIARYIETIKKEDQIRIAYSMLESTRIPQEWVLQLNLYFDAVAVPDPFLIDVYQKSGVTIPVFVLPLGINLDDFLKHPIKHKRKSPMVFANLSVSADRKNQLLLIQAFAKVLGNNKDAVLKINCRRDYDGMSQKIRDEIEKLGCSNIQFTELTLRNDAYLKFFQSVDCYVSLSKGEGFSIQPREAMSLGIPVIVTNNTGQSTICKSGLVKSVESPIAEPVMGFYGRPIPIGNQFNCTVDEAAEAINDVYLNYDKYLEKGEEARKWAAQYNYSNQEIKAKYNTLVSPKKIVLGLENVITPEYIMTDSTELYEKYQKLIIEHEKVNSERIAKKFKWKRKKTNAERALQKK